MPRCASGCATSSASPKRIRIDEAVAGPRVIDEWGCWACHKERNPAMK